MTITYPTGPAAMFHAAATQTTKRPDNLPKCPECGSDSELYRQDTETSEVGGVAIVDYLVCKNPACKNSRPPVAVVK